MEQEFAYQNEVHTIKLEIDDNEQAKADCYTATIEDAKLKFNISKISDNSFSIIINSSSHMVYAAESDDSVFIHLDGKVLKLGKVGNDQKKFTAEGHEFGAKDEISTPMPGKVVKILVDEGDQVESGQPLVIVESMKMENDIKSPTNGSVKSIHFQAGDLVKPGQPIIKLDPN